jgi:hypothetical protein
MRRPVTNRRIQRTHESVSSRFQPGLSADARPWSESATAVFDPPFPTPYSLARLLHAVGTSTRRAVLLLRLEFPWISASEIRIALTGIGYPSAEIDSVLVDLTIG